MSNVIMMEGFDLYNGGGTNTGFQGKWIINGSAPSFIAGRFGGQSARFFGGSQNTAVRILSSAQTTVSFGSAFRLSALPTATPTAICHFALKSDLNFQVGIQFAALGGFSVYRASGEISGTLLGSTATSLYTPNTWNYLEAEVVLSTTVGRVTLYLNGAQVLNLTNVNTVNYTTTPSANYFSCGSYHGGNAIGTYDYDDIYVTDSATRQGERRVETLRPTADTVQKDWTPSTGTANYATVDDTLADGTDYVYASTLGALDLYDMADLSTTPLAIDAVQISTWAMKSDALSRNIALVADLNGTRTQSADFALPGNFQKQDTILNQKPGGGNWDANTVAQLKVGPKITL